MGDVSTHAEITEFVVSEVRRTIHDPEIPEAEYSFLELGNFLTDVSQFRDPTAFHRARGAAVARVNALSYRTAWIGNVDGWARDVFGEAKGPRHGALPEMMRLLVQGFTHVLFDTDGLPRFGAALQLTAPGVKPALLPAHGIRPASVSRALRVHFTQYYPHEHLDFPPTRTAMARHRRDDPLFATAPRGLIQYLEVFIRYLSEALTQLEAEWVQARVSGLTAPQRQDFLIRLGHLLHPVEDYFFHSNLLEHYQWSHVRGVHPAADPAIPADLQALIDDGLAGTRLDATSASLRRKLFRRLRYPVWGQDAKLSKTTSDNAVGLVYTGGFGETDVWHTLGGALEGIESGLERLPRLYDPRCSPIMLFRLLLSRAERQDMVQRNLLENHQKTHRDQLRSGDFATAIGGWEAKKLICGHAGDLLREAFALDLKISESHKGSLYDFPGPGAVLLAMLDQMQRERDASAKARVDLDRAPVSMYSIVSDNTCSEENVGTHSLMSKDATDKEPMRPEAVALAKHASAGIATTLLNRVYSAAPATEGIDWDAVLEFFLRGPSQAQGAWETELISQVRVSGVPFAQPPVLSLNEQPQIPLLGPTRDAARLDARRRGSGRRDLEWRYQGFESNL